MKEKIYTIPLTDAFSEDAECPFCALEKKLEEEQVEYALGASMMEPDSRIISNEKGYCRRHFAQMSEQSKALSLALVLDTHLNELISKLENGAKETEPKKSFFKKEAKKETPSLLDVLQKNDETCVICDKIHDTLETFCEVFWYLYKNEPDFKEKALASKGFCLSHFALLLKTADHELSGALLKEYTDEIIRLELTHLKRINEEVNWFTKKFDYRYQNESWKNSKDAPKRAMEKLSKFL